MKKIIKIVVAIVVVSLTFGLIFTSEKNFVKAATPTNYLLKVDYTKSFIGYGMPSPTITNGSDSVLEAGSYYPKTLKITLKKPLSKESTVEAASGSIFNFNSVSIFVETDYTIRGGSTINSYSIRNINGTVVTSSNTASQPTCLFNGTLSDGAYYINLEWHSGDYMSSYPNYTQSTTTYNISYSFIIDSTKPIIMGASTNKTDYYKNTSFIVSASDNGNNGVDLYMKSPDSSSYEKVDNPITIQKGKIGLYEFYAIDKAQNKSSTYYVNYDDKIPTGMLYNSSGNGMSGSIVNYSFRYKGTDNESGIERLECKKPNSGWEIYNGELIEANSTNGTYSFRTIDKAGNYSAEREVYLDSKAPLIKIYGETDVVLNNGFTNAKYITFSFDGTGSTVSSIFLKTPSSDTYSLITKVDRYTENGTYMIYCYDVAGNKSITYSVTLDNEAPILISNGASFGSSTSNDFSVSASDASKFTLYYKGPNDSIFHNSSDIIFNVTTQMDEGIYRFYAVDKYQNKSDEVWIELEFPFPEINIEYFENSNYYKLSWTDMDYDVRINGVVYYSGAIIREENTYHVVVINSYFKTRNYDFTISHKYKVVNIIKPSCIEMGYTLNECITCGAKLRTNVTDLVQHSYNETIVEASCLEKGFTYYECEVCKNSYKDYYTNALGHSYDKKVVLPTCMDRGYTLYKCVRCEDNYIDEVTEAIGHSFKEKEKEPTCTESGGTFHVCSICNYEFLENEILPYGHSYISKIVNEATCEATGERLFVCDKCSDSYNQIIPILSHNYELIEEKNEDGVIERTYQCSLCGDIYVEKIGNQYEKVANYVINITNTYIPYIIWILLATCGIWSIAMGIAIIIAHKNEDKAKAKKMLVNYIIGLVIIFVIIVAIPYLVRGVAFLIS